MNIKKLSLVTFLTAAVLATTSVAALASSAMSVTDLNVRDEAGGYVIDVLYDGEVVDVLDCDYGWCYIEHSGPDGWVSASYLDFDYSYDDEDYDDEDYYDEDDYYEDVDVEFGVYADNGGVEFGFEISN